MSRLLHITTAAELVDLPELILVAECELGRLPHVRPPGEGIHIDADDLHEWSMADYYDDDLGDELDEYGIDWAAVALAVVMVVVGFGSAAAGYMLGAAQ